MSTNGRRLLHGTAAPLLALTLCVSQALSQTPKVFFLFGDFWGPHDPSIAKDGNTWYLFATGTAPDGG